jgi:NADH:ubiquinone oxidoreductase subunit K
LTFFLLLITGFFLALAGLFTCLTNKRFLGFLFGIELILNGAALNFASFFQIHNRLPDYQVGIILVISFAVIETVIGLSIFTWAAKAGKGQPELSLI